MNKGQESISEIQDNLQNLVDTSNEDENLKSNLSKTGTVEDIINKKINSLEDYLDSRVINIYQRPWNKLELKLKIKKINEYYNNGPKKNEESESESKRSKKKTVEAFEHFPIEQVKTMCNSNDKKRVKVDYDEDLCRINSIQITQ